MSSDSLHKLLIEANNFREEDKLEESVQIFDKVINLSKKENNFPYLIEALHGKFLSLKHLYLLNPNSKILVLSQKIVKTALKISQKQNNRPLLSISYFRLAELYMLSKKYSKAVKNYQKSIDFYNQENAQKGDYLYHLGEALFLSGQTQKGQKTIFQGLSLIKKYKNSTDPFLYKVWLSGCYLKLSELLFPTNPNKSKHYFNLAQKIIESDPSLIIRKRQLSLLSKKF